jgi:serine/threonine-protein kinase
MATSNPATSPGWRPADAEALVGRVLAGKYRLTGVIASGNTSAVFRGTHVDLGAPIAVRVLFGPFPAQHLRFERFLKEARIGARVNHPGIVKVLDADASGNDLRYVVTELLEGETLERKLAAARPLPLHEAILIASEVASALHAVHETSCLHRDVQPANIFVLESSPALSTGAVKLMGFGLAKTTLIEMDENAKKTLRQVFGSDRNAATMPSLLHGNPSYQSPEQIRGEKALPASDVYSLGAVLYAMLTGQPPFGRDASPTESMARHLAVRPEPPSSRVALPSALDHVVCKALAKHPSDRYESAEAFRLALAQALPEERADEYVVPLTPVLPGTMRRSWLLAMAVLGAALLTAGVVWREHLFPPAQLPVAPSPSAMVSRPPLEPQPSPEEPSAEDREAVTVLVTDIDDPPSAAPHPARLPAESSPAELTEPVPPAASAVKPSTSEAGYRIDDLANPFP